MTIMESITIIDPVLEEKLEDDFDGLAHIIYPKDALVESIITGIPCTALCGKIWRPNRDPKNLPLCAACKGIAQGMGWQVPNA